MESTLTRSGYAIDRSASPGIDGLLLFSGVVRDDNNSVVQGAIVILFACLVNGVENPLGHTCTDKQGLYFLTAPSPTDYSQLVGFKVRASKGCIMPELTAVPANTAEEAPNRFAQKDVQVMEDRQEPDAVPDAEIASEAEVVSAAEATTEAEVATEAEVVSAAEAASEAEIALDAEIVSATEVISITEVAPEAGAASEAEVVPELEVVSFAEAGIRYDKLSYTDTAAEQKIFPAQLDTLLSNQVSGSVAYLRGDEIWITVFGQTQPSIANNNKGRKAFCNT